MRYKAIRARTMTIYDSLTGERITVPNEIDHLGTTDLMIMLNLNHDDVLYALSKDYRFERFIDNLKEY